jgi:TfoX/Sxy family transcriptional regulator of competence genes
MRSLHRGSVPPAAEYDHRPMAYDERLAERIRELVGDEPRVTERKMFGGLAFLVGGNMAVAASGQGGLLVRVDPTDSDRLVDTTPAYVMEMRGRSMTGWLRVDTDDVKTEKQLAPWVARGVSYARSLPVKRKTGRGRGSSPDAPV